MMFSLLTEAAVRSLALGAVVWLILKVMRVRNVHVQLSAWTIVLFAALLMPVLMRRVKVNLPPAPLPVARAFSTSFSVPVVERAPESRPAPQTPIHWGRVLTFCLLAGVAVFLARLVLGIALTWRLWRAASPISEPWAQRGSVRVSPAITVPVTYGSTILLPRDYTDWPPALLQAVLAHERSHVRSGDFYIQLVAGLHRAIFWFSPLAWWLHKQLAALAEARSDEEAIAHSEDRPSYAQILLDFAARAQRMPAVVSMARPATVAKRVERILTGLPVCENMSPAKKLTLAATLVPLVLFAAACSVRARAQGTAAPQAQQAAPAIAGQPSPSRPRAIARRNESRFEEDAYAIVSGDSSTVMHGSSSNSRQARALRNRIDGDYIWFERDLKFYYITDSVTVRRAKEFFVAQEELGRQQEKLGAQQEKLGEEQEKLGEQQALVSVDGPDLDDTMAQLRRDVENLQVQLARSTGKGLRQEEIGNLQERLGEMQAKVGDLQSRTGAKQELIGRHQARLGQAQADLGQQQAQLGEQQARLAEEADRKMQTLLDEAVSKGLARAVN